MKVFVSSPTFDPAGTVDIDTLSSSDFGVLARRANKVATLDGGVAVNDFGYTDADRDFRIVLKPSPAIDEKLRYLVRNYAQVHVSTHEGFYSAIPAYSPRPDLAIFTLSITEQIA